MGAKKIYDDYETHLKEYQKEYRIKNKEKLRKYQAEYKKKNPKSQMLATARHRAKELGLEFNLTEDDIVIPDKCPILGIPLEFIPYKRMTSPSLDRIDNSKGYTRDNIRVISTRANAFKGSMTKEQIENLYRYVFST